MSSGASAIRSASRHKKSLTAAVRELERRKPDDHMTAEEAAEVTGVSVQTVYNWCGRGDHPLKHERPGREYRILVRDLLAFLRAKTDGASSLRRLAAVPDESGGGEPERAASAETEVRTFTLTPSARAAQLSPPVSEGLTLDIELGPARAALLEQIRDPNDARRLVEAVVELSLRALRWRRAALVNKAAQSVEDKAWSDEAARTLERESDRLLEGSAGIEPQVVEMLLLAIQEAGERLESVAAPTLVAATGGEGEGVLLSAGERARMASLTVTTEMLRELFEIWSGASEAEAAGGVGTS